MNPGILGANLARYLGSDALVYVPHGRHCQRTWKDGDRP